MRPVRQKWVARAVVAAVSVLGCGAAAGAAVSASGRAAASAPLVTPTATGSISCPAHRCAIKIPSDSSTSLLSVQAMELPGATAPPSVRATPAAKGMLTWDQQPGTALNCSGYTANDSTAYQFFLGQSTLGNVLYSLTYTVKRTNSSPPQACLGARFKFKTASGADARPVTLPNGLSGFVGLLPKCRQSQRGQLVACLRSRKSAGANTVLTAQVPAIGGDPWVRS